MSVRDPKQSILEYFYHWEKVFPDKIFLRQPYGERWHTMTYAEAGLEARKMTTILRAKGLKPGDHIGIVSKNCYHWILADLAIMMGGFVSVPYYASLPKHQLAQVIGLSDLKALFIGKLDQWGDKSEAIPNEVEVIRFPQYPGNAVIDIGDMWDEVTENAEPASDQFVPDGDDIWTIKFTSGTTGTPKGVMHVHKTPASIAQSEYETGWLGLEGISELTMFSFLPLNHVAERIAVQGTLFAFGGTVSFAESLDTFLKNLQDVKPSFFFAVPRIWTKFYLGVLDKIPKKKLDLLFRLPVISGLVKKKIKSGLGFDRLEFAATAAAITPAFLKEFYKNLDIHLTEAYGMTETCGSITNGPERDAPIDSVGRAIPEASLKIDPETGEILMKTPYMMTGYYKEPEKTAAVFKDGWLCSGDRGTIDEQGYVRVIGRVKDAFKTSKGEYITPNPLEEELAKNAFIEQVCVVGLGIPQPLAMINLSETGQTSDQEIVRSSLLKTLQVVNERGSKFEHISTLIIDPVIWSESNDLLTPTLKVKRWKLDEVYGVKFREWHEAHEEVIWLE